MEAPERAQSHYPRPALAGRPKTQASIKEGVNTMTALMPRPVDDVVDMPDEPRLSTAPDRSLDQRMAALKFANEVRCARAQTKRDLKAGRLDLVGLLVEPVRWELETAKVLELLLATPKIGRTKALKALNACRISPAKTVGGMTARQRAELAGYFRGH